MPRKKPTIQLIFLLVTLLPLIVSAQISPDEAISQMKKGINLGNTLEPPYEGNWGNPPTQEYFFDMYKNEGFDVVRIPVRWDKHMGTSVPFKIDESWLNRVEQIVDWGLKRGLFIVINSHHDNWIKDGYTNATNRARFDSLWTQVALRFKNKSEKLIFEVLNEPHGLTKVQNDDMHGRILSIIRKTNPTRLVIFQGHNWGGSDELLSAAIPNDKYIIGSFHSYDPWPFGLEGTGTFTSVDVNNLRLKFQKVKDWSVANNIPVFLGEYGGTDKCEYNARMRLYKTYVELAESFGFAPCVWDDGGQFRIMMRQTKSWFDDIKDIVVKSSVLSPGVPGLQIIQDTILKIGWSNYANDYDSILIERKTPVSSFVKVASLSGNTSSYLDKGLPQNTAYYYRIIGHYESKPDLFSCPQQIFLPKAIVVEPPVRKPYLGQAIQIPGILEFENFDIGGQGYTYFDSDSKNITGDYRPDEPIDIYSKGNGAYLVADNFPGEWLEYSVNISQKGLYTFKVNCAAFEGGGTFRIKCGEAESEIIAAPTSYSWLNTKSVSFTMNLESGPQILRVTILSKPLFNLDNIEITRNIPSSSRMSEDQIQLSFFQSGNDFRVRFKAENATGLKLFSISGTEIRSVQNPSSDYTFSRQGLHPGIYIVQLITQNQRISKKITIH